MPFRKNVYSYSVYFCKPMTPW